MLILISSPEDFPKETEIINTMFSKGLEYLHLRKPAMNREELAVFIRNIPQQFHNRIIVSSHFNLINEFELGGLHFNKKNVTEFYNYRKFNCLRGYSSHSFEEVKKYDKQFDYQYLSTVWDSKSKPGYMASFSKKELLDFFINTKHSSKIIALGGINHKNYNNTMSIGFNGVAMLGYIWDKEKTSEKIAGDFNDIQNLSKYFRPRSISIAGFDPSGGAGVLADIKTFENYRVYGFGVSTSITFQSENSFKGVKWLEFDDIENQLNALNGIEYINFVKIGLVKDLYQLKKLVNLFISINKDVKIIWDPVLKASSGFNFNHHISKELLYSVLRKVYLVTPNWEEYKILFKGINPDYICKEILENSLCKILVKGGHKGGNNSMDILYSQSQMRSFDEKRIEDHDKHGTGCVLSSAITSNLAKGKDLISAIKLGKGYVTGFIKSSNMLLGYHNY